MKASQSNKQNGMAFILHIWGNQDSKIDLDEPNWSPGFILINYLTHQVGVAARGFEEKIKFLAYIDSF